MPGPLEHHSARFLCPPKFLPDSSSSLPPWMVLLWLDQLRPAHSSWFWFHSLRSFRQFFPKQFLVLIKQLHDSASKLAHDHFPIHQTQPFMLSINLKPPPIPGHRPILGHYSLLFPTQHFGQIPGGSS